MTDFLTMSLIVLLACLPYLYGKVKQRAWMEGFEEGASVWREAVSEPRSSEVTA